MKKQSAYWMKFSSLMAFSLQSYPQPLLIFFCPKQKSFMKCAFVTPFSTNVFFSHTIYLPTDASTFEMLFSPVPFGKERLGEEWKKRKKNFRQNALPIWNYNYKSLLRLLYQFKCTPDELSF
ncbi:competence protein CoiA family protein [Bacillus cereus]